MNLVSTFQDRTEPIQLICDFTPNNILLNVYGEAGIGKSRLLKEAKLKLQETSPAALVIIVNIETLAHITTDRPAVFLRQVIEQAEGRLNDQYENNDQLADAVVSQLNKFATDTPTYLMFDTTEALQDDVEFWDWVHLYVTEPLVVERRVRQVYAGRIPVPWRRFELRRAVKLLPLGPIAPVEASRALIEQVLLETNPTLKGAETLSQTIDIVLEFSFGHPQLSERLATYTAQHWPAAQPVEQFKKTLCEQEVKNFIDKTLFEGMDKLWIDILWWASVLDWFDPTILQQYIERVMPEMQGKPDYFFIREIARLRTHNTVVWREQRGDRLHGLIRNIVRRCLETMDIERYKHACLVAVETFESIALEFTEEESYAQLFKNEAATYRQRWQSLEEMTK